MAILVADLLLIHDRVSKLEIQVSYMREEFKEKLDKIEDSISTLSKKKIKEVLYLK